MEPRLEALHIALHHAADSSDPVPRMLCIGCPPMPWLTARAAHIDAIAPWLADARAWEESDAGAVLDDPPQQAAEAGGYDLALILPAKQRLQARAELATALLALAPDGLLVTAVDNKAGAGGYRKDLRSLTHDPDAVHELSKFKCRAMWLRGAAVNGAAARHAVAEAAPRDILDGSWRSRPGLFSWNRIDAGSALLARHLPDDLAGEGADFGCGWGWLAAQCFKAAAPGAISALHLVDADRRALACAQTNLDRRARTGTGEGVRIVTHWADLRLGAPVSGLDWIVMNPPFHDGRAQDISLGLAAITAARDALKPGGRLFMVANRHLPYEAELAACFTAVEKLAEEGGYKVHLCRP